MSKWNMVEGVKGALLHAVGRSVVRVTNDKQHCPPGAHFSYGDEFEAAEFSDGSWLAIEYVPGESAWSSWTPGSPGFCAIYIYSP